MMQRAAMAESQQLPHVTSMPAPASIQAQQQLQLQHAHSAGPQHKGHTTHAQHTMQQVQQAQQAAGTSCAGPIMCPQMSEPAQRGPADMHGSSAHAAQHMHGSAQLQLPAACSRLSIAGDTVADAQRQTDQCLAPAATAAATGGPGSHQAAAWAVQRAAAGQHAGQGPWPPGAGPDVDAAKLRAQADQRMQGQPLSVEPDLPPNLKRLRTTSAVDKLKQSGAPGEALSTFIPTPTWGSPRVSDLQPAAMAGNNPGSNSSTKKHGPGGLAAKAAHAASLLAQAAANSAARSNSIAAAGAQDAQMDAAAAGAAVGSGEGAAQAGAQDAADATGASAGPPDYAQPTQLLERRTSEQLATLLQKQRSDDELAAQYRLELQQLKSEHAALQMLTQHADQETRPPVMGHELPLPTPGMPPRSIEGEAEKLATRLLTQTGGDWQASMSAMMELLRASMQQGSQLLRGCNKVPPHAAAAAGAAAAEGLTASKQHGAPAAAAVAAGAADETGAAAANEQAGQHKDRPAVAAASAAPAAAAAAERDDSWHRGDDQQLQEGPAANATRNRRQRWLVLSDQDDTASQDSSHPGPGTAAATAEVAAAAAAAGKDCAFNAQPQTRSKTAMHAGAARLDNAAADEDDSAGVAEAAVAAAAAAAAAQIYGDLVPAAGSRQGSPMHSTYADNGYSSPAVSTALGPSPFSGCRGAPAGAGGSGMMRTRTLTRRQSRLAPKQQPAPVEADVDAAAAETAAFEAAVAAAAAAVASAEPQEPMFAAAGSNTGGVGVVRSRARKSPPATTPTPRKVGSTAVLDCSSDGLPDERPDQRLPYANGGAFAANRPVCADGDIAAAAGGEGGNGRHSAHEKHPALGHGTLDLSGSPTSAEGAAAAAAANPTTAAAHAAKMNYDCSAAAAAAAFAAGGDWAPGWESQQQTAQQQQTQQAEGRGPSRRPRTKDLTVVTDCGGLDDDASWICAGLLDTPGPAIVAEAGGGDAMPAAAAAAAAPGRGPSMCGDGSSTHHQQQQQQELLRQQQLQQQQMQIMAQHQQMQMQYSMTNMQQIQQQQQPHLQGQQHMHMMQGYWVPGGTTGLDTHHQHPAAAAAAVGSSPMVVGQQHAGVGYDQLAWQHMHAHAGGTVAPAPTAARRQRPSEIELAALVASSMQQDHIMQQQRYMSQRQQQHMIYQQQEAQMMHQQEQQRMNHMPSHGAGAAADGAAAAAPDHALLNMLIGWSSDT